MYIQNLENGIDKLICREGVGIQMQRMDLWTQQRFSFDGKIKYMDIAKVQIQVVIQKE